MVLYAATICVNDIYILLIYETSKQKKSECLYIYFIISKIHLLLFNSMFAYIFTAFFDRFKDGYRLHVICPNVPMSNTFHVFTSHNNIFIICKSSIFRYEQYLTEVNTPVTVYGAREAWSLGGAREARVPGCGLGLAEGGGSGLRRMELLRRQGGSLGLGKWEPLERYAEILGMG